MQTSLPDLELDIAEKYTPNRLNYCHQIENFCYPFLSPMAFIIMYTKAFSNYLFAQLPPLVPPC